MMHKTYPLPQVSDTLQKRLAAKYLTLVRASKACVKLVQCDKNGSTESISQQYARSYAFHIDFDTKSVTGFNINEYTSNYKRATIWVKREELEILLAVEEELNQLLQSGVLTADAIKKED